MLPSLNPYLHGLFAILLYLVGNFFTIVILEYKLKNVNLKHTLAGFACVALTGFIVYFVPIVLFGIKDPFKMQVIGLTAAFLIQTLFWWLWFRKDLRTFAPVLMLAFVLSVVIALLVYHMFVWYVHQVAKEVIADAKKGMLGAVGAVKGVVEAVPAVGNVIEKIF